MNINASQGRQLDNAGFDDPGKTGHYDQVWLEAAYLLVERQGIRT
jgi:hypothetical protein